MKLLVALILLSFACHSAAVQCQWHASPSLFGDYDPLNINPTDTTNTLTIRCQGRDLMDIESIRIQIKLSEGDSNDYQNRYLANGSRKLFYNLYLDPLRSSSVWGDGSNNTVFYDQMINTGINNQINIYGRIPAGQDVRFGGYQDSITATLLFDF